MSGCQPVGASSILAIVVLSKFCYSYGMYKDPEKQKEFRNNHYKNNKDRYRSSRKKNRSLRVIWFQQLKSLQKCSVCGFSDWRCLDFHHRIESTKSFAISEAVRNAYSEAKILEEINKCDVLCVNCHVKHHRQEKKEKINYFRNVKENIKWINEFKESNGCRLCSITDPFVLTFHHLFDKKKGISQMLHTGYSLENIKTEISKCEVLCFNCHRIEHDGNKWSYSAMV